MCRDCRIISCALIHASGTSAQLHGSSINFGLPEESPIPLQHMTFIIDRSSCRVASSIGFHGAFHHSGFALGLLQCATPSTILEDFLTSFRRVRKQYNNSFVVPMRVLYPNTDGPPPLLHLDCMEPLVVQYRI